jgi:hypothetical protein
MILWTRGSSGATSTAPDVSTSTVQPASSRRSASTNALRWMSGSPPVISTSGVPISATRSMMASSDIFSPPWNEYSVSHQTQRSGQPVRRMNVHGSPAQVLSPWTEWKISVMRRNAGVAVVPPVWLMVPIPAVPAGPAITAS